MNLIEVPLELIDEDKYQPRSIYNEESIDELVQSIKEIGLQSPIKVQLLENGRYRIIFGHRRFKACKILGKSFINAILADDISEQDIFFQQLAENIQREGFTPIEEAQAYRKALDNENWKISVKYLASTLGKTERYISNKLSLLNFGSTVKMLIHKGNDIKKDGLTEQQALQVKDIPIEYRDQVAIKIAKEGIPVNDAKKISILFSSKDIKPKNKESFLKYNHTRLLNTYEEYCSSIKKKNEKITEKLQKPHIVSDNTISTNEIFQDENLPILEKVRFLLNRIPSAYPIPDDVIGSYKVMKIDEREDFIYSIDCLIESLKKHLSQWQSIKDTIQNDSIQRIK